MCGRYFLDDGTFSGVNGDICPGMDAPALVRQNGRLVEQTMRWGFANANGSLVINARVETMGEKPMFRALASVQRCAMPATRYYEWRSDRQKYNVSLSGGTRFYLGGLYRYNAGRWEFVVLTQPPVGAITRVHDRMPLLLNSEEAVERWLGGELPLFGDASALRVDADGPEQLRMDF